jgi:hypothetical protein
LNLNLESKKAVAWLEFSEPNLESKKAAAWLEVIEPYA